jgi:hypothetical protein
VEVCRKEEREEAMERPAAQTVVKVRATHVVPTITVNLRRVYVTLTNFISRGVIHLSHFTLFIFQGSYFNDVYIGRSRMWVVSVSVLEQWRLPKGS